jgi:thioredoxin 1
LHLIWSSTSNSVDPSRYISLTIFSWAKEYKGAKFYKFDVDQLPGVAQELGIQAMPTFIFYKDGEIERTIVGAHLTKLKDAIVELTEKA